MTELKLSLLGLNTDELRRLAVERGFPAFRGSQMADWLYRRNARTVDEMVSLPGKLREELRLEYVVGRSRTAASQRASDGTVKMLLELSDGACVETVGIPYAERYSCCVSTQAGCPMGCVFCATGHGGFKRNLTAGEIVDQVLTVNETVRSDHALNGLLVDHVTFMGMGEPLINYDSSKKALKLLKEEVGISARHLTISTIGHVPGIRRLMHEGLAVTLAVSLHAPDDELRKRLVPGSTRWNLSEIIAACKEYVSNTGRRVTIEYCLIDGINDSPDQAHQLVSVLKGLNCHVNLIPFNPVPGLPFRASDSVTTNTFQTIISSGGLQVTQRLRRGADIDAACGQLRQRHADTSAK